MINLSSPPAKHFPFGTLYGAQIGKRPIKMDTAIGSAGAGVLLDRVDAYSMEQAQAQSAKIEEGKVVDWNLGGIYNFSAKYSPWAMWDVQGHL